MSIAHSSRFAEALRRFDQANADDPRTEMIDGTPQPRELLFARRVYDWVLRLNPEASEELLLAARAHTLKRWMVPRDQYPMTRSGYHQWRRACAEFHAVECEKILTEIGYDNSVTCRVTRIVLRSDFPSDPDSRILEDADCLVFLQTKLQEYITDWGTDKTVRILRQTLNKMTPTAVTLASNLQYEPAAAEVIRQAMGKIPLVDGK